MIGQLVITDGRRRVDLAEAWTDVEVREGHLQAPHVRVELADPDLRLLDDPLTQATSSWLTYAGRRSLLSAIAKDGRRLTLTFEDVHVRRLRSQSGELTVDADLQGFIRRLARDADVPVALLDVPTPADEEIGRGDEETSWDAIVRLGRLAGCRTLMDVDGLVVADDNLLMGRQDPVVLSERTDGVDDISFTVDEGVVADRAVVEVRAEPGQIRPGSRINLKPAWHTEGDWTVAEVVWRPHRDLTRLDLIRPGADL